MAVKEVLQLGISGAELILKTLNAINKAKAQFAKKTTGALNEQEKSQLQAMRQAKTDQAEREELQGTSKNTERMKKFGDAVAETARGLSSMNGFQALKATANAALGLIPVMGPGLQVAASTAIDTLTNFRDSVKQAANTNADTADIMNTALKYTAGQNGQGGNSNFLRGEFQEVLGAVTRQNWVGNRLDSVDRAPSTTYQTGGRSDISASEQRGIVEAIGSSMGKFTDSFQGSVKKLFGSNAPGGKAYDVKESTALAQGQFAALGTDTGFFMQKISDGFSNLPPTIRQALVGQMQEMVPENERAIQTDAGQRAVAANFEQQDRNKAAELANYAGLASQIQNLSNSLDVGLTTAINGLITSIQTLRADPNSFGRARQ